jgi:hypothetical protein
MNLAATRATASEARALAIPKAESPISARVVLALTRTETRKLFRHPAFLGALGLVALVIGRGALGGALVGGPNSGGTLLVVFVGLFAATLLSANLAALRSRRDRTDELFGSTPLSRDHRTAAHLLSVLAGPCTVALVLSAGAFFLRLDGRLIISFEPTLPLQGVLVVAAFGAFAVALARWIPSILAAPVAIVAHMMTPLIWVVPWVVLGESGARMGWHFVYLSGAIVFFATIAFVRDRPRPARVAVAAATLALTVTAAVLRIPSGGW